MNALGIHHSTMEDNISNLTSASGEASVSSSGISQQPVKKKRNQPGHPDPGAEVIALSPKTLMTTNRFVCDVCNKGFQRDQNLQLHRRGHNLPWKLKQKSNKEFRRKVYICPENGCVHHDPSRALGDLTGIKKHFYRKHGEKKWNCEKCSKKYAVQSDWKAHMKICGTREYRCDCGTLFSRRDSFITHRAFCDTLAQKKIDPMLRTNDIVLQYGPNSSQTYLENTNNLPFHIMREHQNFTLKKELPPWLSCSPIIGASLGPPPPPPPPNDLTAAPSLLLQEFHQNSNPNPSLGPTTLPPYHHHHPPHISATALLQKASQMGAKSSHVTAFVQSRDHLIRLASNPSSSPPSHEMMMMMMMMNNGGFDQGPQFDDDMAAFGQIWNHPSRGDHSLRFHANEGDDLTRDFLGLRPMPQDDIMSINGLDRCMNSSSCNENQNQTPKSWQG